MNQPLHSLKAIVTQRHFFSVVLTAILCMSAIDSALAADVWVSPVHITRVYPQGDGSIILTVDDDNNSCPAVGVPKYYSIVVGQNGVTADALKNMLAVALSAFYTHTVISINISDTTTNCYVNRLFVQ